MFDRLQKPFLTVETGEAYQPLRIAYQLLNHGAITQTLNSLACLTPAAHANSWNWYWKAECDNLRFESLDSFQRRVDQPLRLGSFVLKDDVLYLSLPSFKRACLAAPFFHNQINSTIACAHHVDFINKVFAFDERLPHGFAELFKENELERILRQRVSDYDLVQERCEQAKTAEEAFTILKEYTDTESKKRLPYAERYVFDLQEASDPEIAFLSFYIFLRGRELVAIKRWFGETGYTLADAADETIEQVFGGMDIDILE